MGEDRLARIERDAEEGLRRIDDIDFLIAEVRRLRAERDAMVKAFREIRDLVFRVAGESGGVDDDPGRDADLSSSGPSRGPCS